MFEWLPALLQKFRDQEQGVPVEPIPPPAPGTHLSPLYEEVLATSSPDPGTWKPGTPYKLGQKVKYVVGACTSPTHCINKPWCTAHGKCQAIRPEHISETVEAYLKANLTTHAQKLAEQWVLCKDACNMPLTCWGGGECMVPKEQIPEQLTEQILEQSPEQLPEIPCLECALPYACIMLKVCGKKS
jgi:hypothetical protein